AEVVDNDVEGVSTIDLNRFSTGRTNIWKAALSAADESPWLGLGPNGYLFIDDRPYGIQPHNLIVQFYVEWGVVGGGMFILLLLFSVYFGGRILLYKSMGEIPVVYHAAALIILVLSLLGLLDGTYFHSQPVFYLTIAFAIFPYNLKSCR
ncbi:MAG: O-antigen ligase family protein, partial [Pseudomonadales bacterium]|nr:O-antigen ligase family protein [Pseudomonadales bacterium]